MGRSRSPSACRSRNAAKLLHRWVREMVAHGARCAWCGREIDLALKGDLPEAVSADHKVERADGGTDTRDNVQPMHVACNHAKGQLARRIREGRA